jgi:uncharacterized OB-fold protein
VPDTPEGPLPRLTAETAFFWTSGADGVLRLLRCTACRRYAHPPTPSCRSCGGDELRPGPVSGRAALWSATTSYQKLLPSVEVPYTVAIVALAEQADLHLTTRLVGIPPDDVRIGMPLLVRFEQHGDVHLPLFGPVPA